MSVRFEDYSVQVKGMIRSEIIARLHEAGGELRSAVQRKSAVGKVGGGRTKGAWDYIVDENNLKVTIGNPMENAIWEEFGTGEWADGEKGGRKGGWYIPLGSGTNEMSENVAEAYNMKIVHGKDGKKFAYSEGKRPKHTFQKVWDSKKGAIKRLFEGEIR